MQVAKSGIKMTIVKLILWFFIFLA